MAYYMPPQYVPAEPKWKHWPTYIYDVNYKYGINFYQPMIDYIDKKGRTSSRADDYHFRMKVAELPELPWSDGRYLWQERPVEPYSREKLIKHAIDAEDQARDHLSHFKIANRSDFSLSKTAQASHVTREVFPRKLEQIRAKPLLFLNSARVRADSRQIQREMAEINLRSLKDVQTLAEVQDTLDRGKSLRGKSARAIEFQLRAEAMKTLNMSQQLADIRKYQRENLSSVWDGREHLRLVEARAQNLIDEEKLTAPLNSLSRQLRGFEEKSSNYFLDQRYRHPTRPRRLYGCLG
ncbi:paramyosin, short form [Calliopsis andreniformis]|uniref:paramyosin, short form n=1 Tax=Calliopsis andreniformis TaxID=337506 RepID=UPI003FCD7D98